MTLIRWNPRAGRELARFHNEFDRLFDDLVGGSWSNGPSAATFLPPIDLEENAEGFVLRADLPGLSQKDVSVRLVGDTLVIAGERKAQTQKDVTTHHKERVVGRFERSLTLGTPVRADQVEASFREGVLEVRIPKADEARVREIEVKVG
jgi:HSP20 family protein